MSPAARSGSEGFSLIEAMVAMSILAVGLLGLAQVFCVGMQHSASSPSYLVAREKAREAVESVHTARDTRTITWAQIRNASNGGVFLDGPQPLRSAGVDGLVNTADDANAPAETIRDPGPDGVLGTADDIVTPLAGFTREIQILELNPVNPELREIVVTIRFQVGTTRGNYTLRTLISAFA